MHWLTASHLLNATNNGVAFSLVYRSRHILSLRLALFDQCFSCSPLVTGVDCKICGSWISSLWDLNRFVHSFFMKILFSALFRHTPVFRLGLILWVRIWLWHISRLIGEKITQRFHQIHVLCVSLLPRSGFAVPQYVLYRQQHEVFLAEGLLEELVFVSFLRFVRWCQHEVFYLEK